jgi:hypothetical protein
MQIQKLAIGLLIAIVGATASQVCAQSTPLAPIQQIPLYPEFDLFGNQFEVVQAYENELGELSITAGIYDTGASVVTFSAIDQDFFFDFQDQPPIPILKEGGASADAIGGTRKLVGDVSVAGRIHAAGASALIIDFDTFDIDYNLDNAVSIGGIQAFIGTSAGSENLPSIVGTPINEKSVTNPFGLATVMDQTGYQVDLGALDSAFAGIPFNLPDVRFTTPGNPNALVVPDEDLSKMYDVATIPLSLVGVSNLANPGLEISAAPNPVQNQTSVAYTSEVPGSSQVSVSNQSFLFDTGAQLSVISTAIAAELGLTDIEGNPIVTPHDFIDVQGAAGSESSLPGYILDSLTLPRTDDGFIQFTDVPVYVLDIGFGIDGILGMNLFNGADSFVYDPYHPDGAQMSVRFLIDRTEGLLEDEALLATLDETELQFLQELGLRYAVAQPIWPGLSLVPEPHSAALASIGLAMLASWRRRGLRRRVV